MKILLAADGSPFTKKALGWLLANHSFDGTDDELVILNVQAPMPPRVRAVLPAETVKSYYEDEALKVLAPIDKFMKRHTTKFSIHSATGNPAEEIIRLAKKQKVHLIVMGTHGRGMLGQAIMGSVAQRVVADSPTPVLLIK